MPASDGRTGLARVGFAAAALGLAMGAAGHATSQGGSGWEAFEERVFSGETRYEVVQDGQVHAVSRGGASGLFRERAVDLEATPILCWTWHALAFPAVKDQTRRGGDDFAARVYVVDRRGFMGLRTRAINYVWARHAPTAPHWRNPYAEQVAMLPLRWGTAGWQTEIRDVRSDFEALLGAEVRELDAVAIMTDSDDSASTAAARYGALHFAANREACREALAK